MAIDQEEQDPVPRRVEWWDAQQVPLYLAAIALGAVLGLLVPGAAPLMEHAIEPVLMLLLFATFLAVPLIRIGRALRDLRFLGTLLIADFAIVPLVAWGLSRFVADDEGLLLGVLLVLLTPCIDYVIVFTGLAGGARAKLLAAAPLLMLVQILLLPLYLRVFAGGDLMGRIDVVPFLRAFLLLIVVPLTAAAVVQVLARRHRAARATETLMAAAMVPLMVLTLLAVIGSQVAAVGSEMGTLARLLPLYAGFVVLAVAIGYAAARITRLDVPSTRALMFSAATRNSLVVLPLALALPASLAIAPLAVVTQTLVELVAMVVMVRLVPVLTPER